MDSAIWGLDVCEEQLLERKLVVVKWGQSWARTDRKGSRVSRQNLVMKRYLDINERPTSRYKISMSELTKLPMKISDGNDMISRNWDIGKERNLFWHNMRNYQPCLGSIHEERLWTINQCQDEEGKTNVEKYQVLVFGRKLPRRVLLQFESGFWIGDKFKPFPSLSLKPNICSSNLYLDLLFKKNISFKYPFCSFHKRYIEMFVTVSCNQSYDSSSH